VIFFAIAFSNTSCSFIIRSIAEAEYVWPRFTLQPRARLRFYVSGQITC
jgi:hypothetical protein